MAIAARLQVALPGVEPALGTIIAAIAFLGIGSLDPLQFDPSRGKGLPRPNIADPLIAFGFFAGAALLLTGQPDFARSAMHLSILVAAAVEEWIFRWLLPWRLAISLTDGGHSNRIVLVGASVLAQIVFVACHFVGTQGAREPYFIAALFTAGLLYAGIVGTAGLGVAVAVHATMNLMLFQSLEFDAQTNGIMPIVLMCMLALGSLWVILGGVVLQDRVVELKTATGSLRKK